MNWRKFWRILSGGMAARKQTRRNRSDGAKRGWETRRKRAGSVPAITPDAKEDRP